MQQFIKDFDEVEGMLEERMKMAEETSRALVNARVSYRSEKTVEVYE